MKRRLRKRNHKALVEIPEILTPAQKRVLYRLDYSVEEVGLAIGRGWAYAQDLIDKGLLGWNPKTKKVPRAEVDRYLMSEIEYKRQPHWRDKYNKKAVA
jgi:ribosomal protein S4